MGPGGGLSGGRRVVRHEDAVPQRGAHARVARHVVGRVQVGAVGGYTVAVFDTAVRVVICGSAQRGWSYKEIIISRTQQTIILINSYRRHNTYDALAPFYKGTVYFK